MQSELPCLNTDRYSINSVRILTNSLVTIFQIWSKYWSMKDLQAAFKGPATWHSFLTSTSISIWGEGEGTSVITCKKAIAHIHYIMHAAFNFVSV